MQSSDFRLTIRSGKGEEHALVLDRQRTVIGKGEDVQISLSGWNVSRRHAVFVFDEENLFIEDLDSMFGTWINGERTQRFGPVRNDTEIVIGSYRLSVDVDAATPSAGTVTEPALAEVPEVARPLAPPLTPPASGQKSAPPRLSVVPPATPPAQVVRAGVSRRPPSEAEQRMFSWRKAIHKTLVERMEAHRIDINRMADEEVRSNVRALIRDIVAEQKDLPADLDVGELSQMVLDEAVGLGPLEVLLRDPAVSEVMVNAANDIWVERGGKLELTGTSFTSDLAVMGAIERIVTPLGRRIDESSPLVDARLKDGSRVNAIIPPLALRGPSITIRKFSRSRIEPHHLIGFGSISAEMIEVLRNAVLHRKNIIVSGGTGTGKTTFLNMLSSFIPDDERIVTIEDAAELTLDQPNLVSLESRPANAEGRGQITIRDLVRNSLRMRPDRIVVGECRGGEALDMLQAMNTGHDGSLTTLHANTPRDAVGRLEILVAMAGMNLPSVAVRAQIASAVHLMVQLTRFSCGSRKVTCISEITGMEGEVMQMQDLFLFRQTGRHAATGKTEGRFEACGTVPDFYGELKEAGVQVDLGIFSSNAGAAS